MGRDAPAVSKDNEVLELPNCPKLSQIRPRSSATTSGPASHLLHPRSLSHSRKKGGKKSTWELVLDTACPVPAGPVVAIFTSDCTGLCQRNKNTSYSDYKHKLLEIRKQLPNKNGSCTVQLSACTGSGQLCGKVSPPA